MWKLVCWTHHSTVYDPCDWALSSQSRHLVLLYRPLSPHLEREVPPQGGVAAQHDRHGGVGVACGLSQVGADLAHECGSGGGAQGTRVGHDEEAGDGVTVQLRWMRVT